MKAFVTGGTGFIGWHVVRKLLERDHEVVALVRSEQGALDLSALGAQVVFGDINDAESMREGMQGSDVVLHIAGYFKVGASDWMKAESINVSGTRTVLRLAHQLGVPKIIYTSTTSVYGDTKGQLVDENFVQGGPFATEYDRTKWLAHYKVAVPMIEKGAPIIIVVPGGVYGPGDHSWLGLYMRLFYEGKLLMVPAPDFIITYAHVEDIAEGHVLAAEKGQIGETYILAGPAVPLGEIVDFWSQLTGRRAPLLRIPARYLKPFGPLMEVLPLPEPMSEEAIKSLQVTYMGRADKARAQLGWRTRSLQEGMSETFAWIAETTPPKPPARDQERKIAGLALLAAALIFLLYLLGRRRE